MLNAVTGEFIDHTPDIITTIRVPSIYDPNATCPLIDKFFSEVLFSGDIITILELIGYCLVTSYKIHTWFLFHGEGENGKSTLINLIRAFLGIMNVASVGLQELNDRFTAATMFGKLANMVADLSDADLKRTAMLKKLTGGDSIFAQNKFKDPFTFDNYAKLVYSCNKIPITADKSRAFFRRVFRISFPNYFDPETRDGDLLDKLTTEEELSGLLNKALIALHGLLDRGYFTGTKSAEENEVIYESASNPVYGFVDERLIIDSESYVPKMELYEEFLEYCKEKKFVAQSNNKFIENLKLLISIKEARVGGKAHRIMVWKGIRIRGEEDSDVSPLSGMSPPYPSKASVRNSYYDVKYSQAQAPDTPDSEDDSEDENWVTAQVMPKSIRAIINECEKDYGEEIPVIEVLNRAEEEGIDRDKAEDLIEAMKRDGILYSPIEGVVKFL